MSHGVVTLPANDIQARWAVLAWLAYPNDRQARLAMGWLADWGLRRIGDKTATRPNRLDTRLAAIEARFRKRLAIADSMNARLRSVRLRHPPWLNAVWDEPINAAHDKAARNPPRDGGAMPPIAIGQLRIVINNPPTTSRALADYIIKKGGGNSEQGNVIRATVTASRPVMALAIAACLIGPGPAYMKGRRTDWDAEDPSTWGLLEDVAFGNWPISPLLALADKTRRELIEFPEMAFSSGDVLEWRRADSF